MFCPIGLELYEKYEAANSARNILTTRRKAAVTDGLLVTDREVQLAKQRYVEHFAGWLGHKAFCQDCKPKAPQKGHQGSTAPGC